MRGSVPCSARWVSKRCFSKTFPGFGWRSSKGAIEGGLYLLFLRRRGVLEALLRLDIL